MSLLDWIQNYRSHVKYMINPVAIDDTEGWFFSAHFGRISRKDNAFFNICAIKSYQINNQISELPIIDQSEIGILGFIINRDENSRKILLQAKSEPGNIFTTQIGPSVQATESNYKSKHHGSSQKYIDFFINPNTPKITYLKQSEQGHRFLNKYNLNVIVEVDVSQIILEGDKYKWFYLDEIISSLNHDYLFNTDFKSVFSHLLESIILEKIKGGYQSKNPFLNSYINNINNNINDILFELNQIRNKEKFDISIMKISDLENWTINPKGIIPKEDKSFGFHFFNIAFSDREIPHWGQPLITKSSIEYIILFCIEQEDEILFVFSESKELGFKNYIQIGPTFQYDVLDETDHPDIKGECIIQFMQSEEGGRFYKNISEYKVYKVDTIEEFNNSEHYKILNLFQVCQLLKIEGVFNNEARNIIASLVSLI